MTRVLLVGINPSGKPFRKGCSLDKMNVWMEALGFHHYSFSNVIPYEGEYKMRDVDTDFVRSFTNGYNKVIVFINYFIFTFGKFFNFMKIIEVINASL